MRTHTDSSGRKKSEHTVGERCPTPFMILDVDDYLLIRVQHSDVEKPALIA